MSAPNPAERSLLATGARRAHPPSPDSEKLVAKIRELTRRSEALVALFDARSIAGERHLLSAWAHLGRSRRSGTSRLRDRGAELALYLSGDDQLGRALARIGISASTEEFVLIAERPHELAPLLEGFGLVADPTIYPRPPNEGTLERLGITAADRSVVPSSGWEGLVLERVALVDLSPGSSTPAKAEGAIPPKSGKVR
ncbi:MAG: KEOPS complex subunit Cgi121 [Thermoplasmata archaeon]